MKPKMSCVNNCNSEVIWQTNPIQIVCLIPFESRVVRQEKIACTSGNIRSQIQTYITHLSTPVLIVWLKGHGDNTKGLWLDIVLHTLLSNCMRRDLKQNSPDDIHFMQDNKALSGDLWEMILSLWYYIQALSVCGGMTSDGSVPGSRAPGRSGLRFSGLFWLGEQVLLSAYIN